MSTTYYAGPRWYGKEKLMYKYGGQRGPGCKDEDDDDDGDEDERGDRERDEKG